MGLQLARAFVSLTIDQSLFNNQLMNVRNSFLSTMGAMHTAAAATLGAAAAASAGLIGAGLAAAGEMEVSLITFEVLLQSAEKAADLYEKLRTMGRLTPYDLPELAEGAKRLINANVAAEDVIDTLTFMGNAASGANTNLNQLLLVYTQMKQVGKLELQDFKQLLTRNAISNMDIADFMGVDPKDIRAMITKKTISFEDVENTFKRMSASGGKYYKLMERIAETYPGLLTNLRDSMLFLKTDIGAAFLPVAKQIVSGFIMITQSVAEFTHATGPLVGAVLGGITVVSLMTATVYGLVVAVKLLGITMRAVLIGTGWGIALVALGVTIGVVITAVTNLWNMFAKTEKGKEALITVTKNLRVAWEVLANGAKRLFNVLGPALITFINIFLKAFGFDLLSAKATFVDAMAAMLVSISEFTIKGSTLLVALVENWRIVANEFPIIMAVAMSYTRDIFTNTFEQLPHIMLWSFTQCAVEMVKFTSVMVAMLAKLVGGFALAFAKIPAMMAEGLLGGNVMGFEEAFKKSVMESVLGAVKGYAGLKPDLSELLNPSAGTEKLTAEMQKRLKVILDRQKELEANARKAAAAAAEKPGPGRKDGAATDGKGMIEAGVYGAAELGKKFQDALLKSQEKAKEEAKDIKKMELAEAAVRAEEGALAEAIKIAKATEGIEARSKETKEEEKAMLASLQKANNQNTELLAALKNLQVLGALT